MKKRSRRLTELVAAVITIAVVCGIAVPMLAKGVARARTIAAKYNLSVAERAIDEAVLEDRSIDAASLRDNSRGINWVDYEGQELPDYGSLSAKQINAVYISSYRSGAICIFSITQDGYLQYSIYSDGSWVKEGKVKSSGGPPALQLSKL